jgi:hypothetical protein
MAVRVYCRHQPPLASRRASSTSRHAGLCAPAPGEPPRRAGELPRLASTAPGEPLPRRASALQRLCAPAPGEPPRRAGELPRRASTAPGEPPRRAGELPRLASRCRAGPATAPGERAAAPVCSRAGRAAAPGWRAPAPGEHRAGRSACCRGAPGSRPRRVHPRPGERAAGARQEPPATRAPEAGRARSEKTARR